VEFHINDRRSFMRFLGMHLGSTVPDFSTVWRFREALTQAEAIKPLFDSFTATLEQQEVITKVGTIVDASFVEVLRQRNRLEDNELVKNGQVARAVEATGAQAQPEGSGRALDEDERTKLLRV